MIFHLTNRRGFLDFLQDRDRAAVSLRTAKSPKEIERALVTADDDDALLLVWRDEIGISSLFDTFVVILPDHTYDDFLSWAFTYVGSLRPLTSFLRVIRSTDIERFDLFDDPKPWLSQKALDALTVSAIAEAYVQLSERGRTKALTVQNCMLTFSFAATKGLYSGLHPSHLIELAERWDDFRRASSASAPPLSAADILPFWMVTSSALIPSDSPMPASNWLDILSALVRRMHRGEVDLPPASIWGQFTEIAEAVAEFAEASVLTRERQIKFLDQAALAIRRTDVPRPLKDAALGLLIARLGDGSLQYLPLAMSMAEELTCTPLWFAFFSAFHKGFDGLTAQNSLGRHVLGKAAIQRDIFDRSKVSLGYDEARIIAQSRNAEMLLSSFGATIDIELLPCVATPMPNPARRVDEERKRELAFDPKNVTRLLRDAIFLLERDSRTVDMAENTRELFEFEDRTRGQTTKRAPRKRK